MRHTHRSRSFADGGSDPFDTSGADVTHGEYSWQIAFQHHRRARKRPTRIPIRVNRHWQIASGKNKAILIQSDTAALKPVGIWRGASHDEEVMGWDATRLPGLLVNPIHFFEVVVACKTGQLGVVKQLDGRIARNALNEITRHRFSQDPRTSMNTLRAVWERKTAA
jgi:hypothetical protein